MVKPNKPSSTRRRLKSSSVYNNSPRPSISAPPALHRFNPPSTVSRSEGISCTFSFLYAYLEYPNNLLKPFPIQFQQVCFFYLPFSPPKLSINSPRSRFSAFYSFLPAKFSGEVFKGQFILSSFWSRVWKLVQKVTFCLRVRVIRLFMDNWSKFLGIYCI